MFAIQTHASLALVVEKMVVLFKESLLGLRWSCDEEQRLTFFFSLSNKKRVTGNQKPKKGWAPQ